MKNVMRFGRRRRRLRIIVYAAESDNYRTGGTHYNIIQICIGNGMITRRRIRPFRYKPRYRGKQLSSGRRVLVDRVRMKKKYSRSTIRPLRRHRPKPGDDPKRLEYFSGRFASLRTETATADRPGGEGMGGGYSCRRVVSLFSCNRCDGIVFNTNTPPFAAGFRIRTGPAGSAKRFHGRFAPIGPVVATDRDRRSYLSRRRESVGAKDEARNNRLFFPPPTSYYHTV